MSDYEIEYRRPKAGHMQQGPWVVVKDGRNIARFDTETAANAWVEKASTVVPQEINLPHRDEASQPTTQTPKLDRSATRVAHLTGLPTPKATGRCHYCGMPLNRHGHCNECI